MLQIKGKPVTLARALRWLQWRWHDRIQPLNAFRGVYASFAEAQHAAPDVKPIGYDSAGSDNWYRSKLIAVSQEDYPVLFWLRSAFEDSRSIFEIGGHIGVAYYGFSTILSYPPGLNWTICDVPTIAAAGEALARERGRNNVQFVTSPSATAEADIVLACGALQYIDAPNLVDIISVFRTRPKHVIINTTPVHDGNTFITLQNIGSAYCPYRVFGRDELVLSLEQLGYALVDSWRKERLFRIPSHPDRSFDHYTGFYFRAR